MRRKYGEVAIEATKYIQATREDPEKAWNKFAEEIFGTGSSGAKKTCPRNAYLGLCADGLVVGVPEKDHNSDENPNKIYAVQAVRMLCADSSLEKLTPKKLWDKVMENIEYGPDNHNNQIDVVVALWHEGMIVGSE